MAQASALWSLWPAVWSYLPLHARRDRCPVHRLCDAPPPGKGDDLCPEEFDESGRVPWGSPWGWFPAVVTLYCFPHWLPSNAGKPVARGAWVSRLFKLEHASGPAEINGRPGGNPVLWLGLFPGSSERPCRWPMRGPVRCSWVTNADPWVGQIRGVGARDMPGPPVVPCVPAVPSSGDPSAGCRPRCSFTDTRPWN